jgi:osmotically-inducible protein OsmY
MKKMLFAGALGAAITYLLDQKRYKQAAQRAQGILNTGRRQAEQAARAAGAQAYGMTQKVQHAGGDVSPPDDDVTLARKVETEIFRDADAPKGSVNVDVVDRVVTLRGQVDDEKQIKSLEKAAKNVDGIRDVKNLLHTPGTPAPNLTGSSTG